MLRRFSPTPRKLESFPFQKVVKEPQLNLSRTSVPGVSGWLFSKSKKTKQFRVKSTERLTSRARCKPVFSKADYLGLMAARWKISIADIFGQQKSVFKMAVECQFATFANLDSALFHQPKIRFTAYTLPDLYFPGGSTPTQCYGPAALTFVGVLR